MLIFTMSNIQFKVTEPTMKQENVTKKQRKKQSVWINPEMRGCLNKNFKTTIINMYKYLKDNMNRVGDKWKI